MSTESSPLSNDASAPDVAGADSSRHHWGLSGKHYAALSVIFVVTAGALRFMGQPWWCKCGELRLWSGEVQSMHNSQHLFDPYTLTHIQHGLILYGLLWLVARNLASVVTRGVIALALEAAWEVWENTDFVIERYREATISLDYYGDSILNSLGDLAACAVGLAAAMTLPIWGSAMGFVLIEVVLILWIRDSLLLNILMLAWPIEAIKNWQMGKL